MPFSSSGILYPVYLSSGAPNGYRIRYTAAYQRLPGSVVGCMLDGCDVVMYVRVIGLVDKGSVEPFLSGGARARIIGGSLMLND